MGMHATIYTVSAEAFAAGVAGDLDAFTPDETGVSLDKAWHAIHYLVTGDADLRFLTTGAPLAEAENCELHSPADVRHLSECLCALTVADLMAKFDADAFNRLNIYQAPWDDSAAHYVQPFLADFLVALHAAARAQRGLFVVLA